MTGKLTSTAQALVHVSHHMFYLGEPYTDPDPRLTRFAPMNGLILVQPGNAVIFVGASEGFVNVTVQPRRDPPPRVDPSEWDEVVETSLRSSSGKVRVKTFMVHWPALPVLTTAGPGEYRLLVHARGRDTAPDLAAFTPNEDYLIVVWPAPAAPDLIHRQTDAYGASWRQAAEKVQQSTAPTAHRQLHA